MKKVNIANYVIYELANRFNKEQYLEADSEIIGLVADKWCKKHFVSIPQGISHHHDDRTNQNFLI